MIILIYLKGNLLIGNYLDITYSNTKIKKICTDGKVAERIYGIEMAHKINQRIGQLPRS